MAPEQAVDSHRADHRADIYSLGCTLYRMLTGEAPYPSDSVMSALLAHRESRIPSLRHVRPDAPARLDLVFRRMVAKRPGDRYQSMVEVIEALQDVLHRMNSGEVGLLASGKKLFRWISHCWLGSDDEAAAAPVRLYTKQEEEQTVSFDSERGTRPPA